MLGGFQRVPRKAADQLALGRAPQAPAGRLGQPRPHTGSSATAQAVSWWPLRAPFSPGPCPAFAQPPLCSSPFSIIAPLNVPISHP